MIVLTHGCEVFICWQKLNSARDMWGLCLQKVREHEATLTNCSYNREVINTLRFLHYTSFNQQVKIDSHIVTIPTCFGSVTLMMARWCRNILGYFHLTMYFILKNWICWLNTGQLYDTSFLCQLFLYQSFIIYSCFNQNCKLLDVINSLGVVKKINRFMYLKIWTILRVFLPVWNGSCRLRVPENKL